MTTTPSGSPAWTRTNSHTDYGGDTEKQNYLSQGAVDAQTDVTAEQICRIAADLEALHRTVPFCQLVYTNNDGATAAPTITRIRMMTGTRLISYEGDAAPSGFPSAARNGDGDVTFTFSASYLDAYGVSGAFAIRYPHAEVLFNEGIAAPEIVSDTQVRIRVKDTAGAALLNQDVLLEI